MDTAARKPWRSAWFWLALVAGAALAAFAYFSPTVKGWIEGVAEWAEGIMRAHPVAGRRGLLPAVRDLGDARVRVEHDARAAGQRGMGEAGDVCPSVGRMDCRRDRRVRHRYYFARPLLHRLVAGTRAVPGHRLEANEALGGDAAVSRSAVGDARLPVRRTSLSVLEVSRRISIAEAVYALGVDHSGREPRRGEAGVLVARLSGLWSSSRWARAYCCGARSARPSDRPLRAACRALLERRRDTPRCREHRAR